MNLKNNNVTFFHENIDFENNIINLIKDITNNNYLDLEYVKIKEDNFSYKLSIKINKRPNGLDLYRWHYLEKMDQYQLSQDWLNVPFKYKNSIYEIIGYDPNRIVNSIIIKNIKNNTLEYIEIKDVFKMFIN